MNRLWRKGLSFALMGTFSSGLFGNNIARARSTVDVAGLHVSLPDAFGDIDYTLASRIDSDSNEFILAVLPNKEYLKFEEHLNSKYLRDHCKFIGGRDIDELLAKLKTILKEASELNDCDEDMGKIRDLRSKFIETSKKFGEKNIDDYIRRHKNEKKVVTGILISAILVWLVLLKIYGLSIFGLSNNQQGTKNEKQTCEGGEVSEKKKSWFHNTFVPQYVPKLIFTNPEVKKYLTKENKKICEEKLRKADGYEPKLIQEG